MARQIEIQCAPPLAGLLVEALEWFVASHYPHGADECSIAAREALLGLAQRFRDELHSAGCCRYSVRVRAFLSEAVNSYTRHREQADGESWERRRAVLIAVCRGLSSGAEFSAAERHDREVSPLS